jgi:hypothetical protein
MGIFGIAKKGFGMLGKGLKSSKTGAIKSIKPGVGGLKKSRKTFEELQKSVDQGKKLHGKEKTHHLLAKQPKGAKLHDLVKKSGELERQRKKLKIPESKN